jgi:hypothetical protein
MYCSVREWVPARPSDKGSMKAIWSVAKQCKCDGKCSVEGLNRRKELNCRAECKMLLNLSMESCITF